MSDDRFKLCGSVFFSSASVLKDEGLCMIIELFESNQSYSGTIHGVLDQNETSSSYNPKENVCISEEVLKNDQLTLFSPAGSLQVLEPSDDDQSESVEPRRLSLDWDSAFFTSAGLLSDEELCMINKGFRTPAFQSETSYESQVCGQDQTSSSDSDEYNLQALEHRLFKDVAPSPRTPFGEKMLGRLDNLVQSKSLEPRRQSLDWDNAFLTSSGLLNNEELSMINKRGTRIGVQPLRVSGLAHTSSSDNNLEALEFGLFKDVKPEAMKDIKSQKENMCISEVKCQQSSNKQHVHELPRTPLVNKMPGNQRESMCISEVKCQQSSNKQHVHELPRTPLVNKMSGTRSQVLEQINRCIPESVDSRRVSLDWDSDFFTSAGLLKDKDLSKINKGFTKHKSNQLDSNSYFDLEDLEGDLFKYIKKRNLYKLTKRSKVAINIAGQRARGQVTPTNMKTKNSPSSVLSPLLSSSSSSASSSSHDATSASITKIKSSGLQTSSSYSPRETLVAELFKELQC